MLTHGGSPVTVREGADVKTRVRNDWDSLLIHINKLVRREQNPAQALPPALSDLPDVSQRLVPLRASRRTIEDALIDRIDMSAEFFRQRCRTIVDECRIHHEQCLRSGVGQRAALA